MLALAEVTAFVDACMEWKAEVPGAPKRARDVPQYSTVSGAPCFFTSSVKSSRQAKYCCTSTGVIDLHHRSIEYYSTVQYTETTKHSGNITNNLNNCHGPQAHTSPTGATTHEVYNNIHQIRWSILLFYETNQSPRTKLNTRRSRLPPSSAAEELRDC